MSLVDTQLRLLLPPLHETEEDPDPIVWARFFVKDANWSWYPIEFDGEDTFYGLVRGFESELGYFLLSELESVITGSSLVVERDLLFSPCMLSKVPRERS